MRVDKVNQGMYVEYDPGLELDFRDTTVSKGNFEGNISHERKEGRKALGRKGT